MVKHHQWSRTHCIAPILQLHQRWQVPEEQHVPQSESANHGLHQLSRTPSLQLILTLTESQGGLILLQEITIGQIIPSKVRN